MQPVSALPGYCRSLDLLTDADVRVEQHMAIGPTPLIEAGAHVALVRPSGEAFRVYGMAGDCCGVFASGDAARYAVFRLGAEWETGLDLSAA